MTEDTNKANEDEIIDAAIKGGKELLASIGKAGLLFTKRIAEGAFNAQIAQSDQGNASEKLKVASKELFSAFVRGAIEGATESFSGLINGINVFTQEMTNKNLDSDDLLE